MSLSFEEYMRQSVQPMRDELVEAGFEELTTEEEVDAFIQHVKGTTLVVVNSVCGCAAGLARPAAIQSFHHSNHPDHKVTVFAGQDREATAKMRMYFGDVPPSSPSMAILKNEQLVHFIPREQIEGQDVEDIVANVKKAYDEYCK
ncbi:BrxA/BrxB family bacilliredoxin [Massilibacterium senegalense]|uniref:BrxA/BrxB family bacilliredoxin n=1 Tax=Massilibacterium senegalense TaxID=1632858 RepID=UPI0007843B4D|nr:BrxA/BrxB family bacilliredoxin [Massilibacterium senegalense]